MWGIVICLGTAAGWAASRLLAATTRRARPAPVPVVPCAVATGVLWGVLWALKSGGTFPEWWLPVPLAATVVAVPLAVADVLHRRLPDVLTVPAYALAALAVCAAALGGPGPPLVVAAVIGCAAALGFHLLVCALAPGAFGAGDVKLSGSLGALAAAAGWPTLVVSFGLASLLTSLLAVVAVCAGVARWRDGVPHGPGLLVATSVSVSFPGGLPSVGS
ncbi:prepilin peptidase [Saccharomonospora xinjiangensis]|uniref:prepilin peptidase n=1 Tax=Saccharomonospora xinjiangensis TaxID=75294 RepID=UPI0010702C94|nr:prepilin peptidase [Saccharomonospora xinjiangensis]QBQ60110.1 Type IV leader peptidase family protein [Saccharomonospora xinjiangensis]